MTLYDIEIDGKRYVGETASAENQFKALNIVCNSSLVYAIKDDVSDMAGVVTLMSCDWQQIEALETLLVGRNIKDPENDVHVARKDFRDEPQNWALLVFKACQANLKNFYKLPKESEKAAEQAEQA